MTSPENPVLPDRPSPFMDVLRRDPCAYCGKRGGSLDHITPRALGGSDDWDNLTSACGRCNGRKSDGTVLDVLLGLREQPNPPQWRRA